MGQIAIVKGHKMEKGNDRVSYSFGMKLSLPAKYESADFHVSLSSDVSPDETLDQAFNRVKAEVMKYADSSYLAIRAAEEGIPQKQPVLPAAPAPVQEQSKAKQLDFTALRKQVKNAFAVLEAQKKIVKADFIRDYLSNKKVDQLTDQEILNVINKIKSNFSELGL